MAMAFDATLSPCNISARYGMCTRRHRLSLETLIHRFISTWTGLPPFDGPVDARSCQAISFADISAAGELWDQVDRPPGKLQILGLVALVECTASSAAASGRRQKHHFQGGKPGYYPSVQEVPATRTRCRSTSQLGSRSSPAKDRLQRARRAAVQRITRPPGHDRPAPTSPSSKVPGRRKLFEAGRRPKLKADLRN